MARSKKPAQIEPAKTQAVSAKQQAKDPVAAARASANAILSGPAPEEPDSVPLPVEKTPEPKALIDRIPFDGSIDEETRHKHALRIIKEDLERKQSMKVKDTWFELVNKGPNNQHLRQMILLEGPNGTNGNLHSTYIGKVKRDAKSCIQPERIEQMKKARLIKPEGWRPEDAA